MAKKNVSPILGLIGALISAFSFFLGAIEISLIFICAAVVLIIADCCREQKSNVWVSKKYEPTNLGSFSRI